MLIKIFHILLNAQNVTHIIIKNDNNENDDLKKKRKRICHAEMTFAKTSIAFTLTRINKRRDASRVKIIRDNTHAAKINENLIRVNAIF